MRLTDEQIGAGLTALRPTPSERFAAELDERAAAGFSAPEPGVQDTAATRGLAGLRRLRWRVWAPVAATAGLAAVVGVVALGGNDAGQPAPTAIEDQSGATLEAPSGAAGTAISPDEAVPPVPPVRANGTAPRNGRTQVQELSGSLGLTTGADEVGEAADGVVDVTNRYDGFVDSSEVRLGGSSAHAFFTLRIPATDLREALDALSGLGKVVSRDESSTNVTGAYVDAGKSFSEARAKVDSLLEDLRDASSTAEEETIRQQLVAARQQLAASRAALRGVKQRVTYAPVSVQIKATADERGWSIGDAVDDAGDVLVAIAGGALVTLAVLVPLGALLALGWLGARELQRRRREAALNR